MFSSPLDTATAAVVDSRRVRLFISSTFQDMQAERDQLVRHVFPRVREYCQARSVEFVECDLRWGITLEQAQHQRVVPLCFREIDRCQPFFLGLIGRRSGWTPDVDHLPQDFLQRHPWIRDCSGLSVTEWEFRYAALNDPQRCRFAWFFSQDAASESECLDELPLQRLKSRLRQSGCDFREGYGDARTLGEWVYEKLIAAINELFPEPFVPGWQREAWLQQDTARRSSDSFHGRERELRQLTRGLKTTRRVALLGPRGIGKAALLGAWFSRLRIGNRQPPAFGTWWRRLASSLGLRRRGSLEIIRFVGLTTASSDVAALADSIIEELHERLALSRTLPPDPPTALSELSSWLEFASQQRPVILVIAGVDQLDGELERTLACFAVAKSADVAIVVSIFEDSESSGLRQRLSAAGWTVQPLTELTERECQDTLESLLGHYSKQLSQLDVVARRLRSRSPGFLRTFVEEIRIFGEFGRDGEPLRQYIDSYLESPTFTELFERVIQRWVGDYDIDRPGLVVDALSLLALSRTGLAESELFSLLGGDAPLPRLCWTPLRISAEPVLTDSGGLIHISNLEFLATVRRKFLSVPTTEAQVRDRLIKFFQSQSPSLRQMDELLWQLARANRWHDVADWLAAPEPLHQLWATHEFVIKSWARQLGSRGFNIAARWEAASRVASVAVAVTIAQLLSDLGAGDATSRVIQHIRDRGETLAPSDDRRLLSIQATHLLESSPQDALRLLQQEQSLCESTGQPGLLAACLGNQATALRGLGRLGEARECHLAEEQLCREQGDLRLLAGSLINQAQLAIAQQDWGTVQRCEAEAERLCHTLREVGGLGRCLQVRAIRLRARHDLVASAAAFREASTCFQEVADNRSTILCLQRLAETQIQLQDLDAAVKSLDDAAALANAPRECDLKTEIARHKQQILDQFNRY